MFSVIENSVKIGAFYLVKLIFGKYFCYFDTNRVADLLQLTQFTFWCARVLRRRFVSETKDLQRMVMLSSSREL